MEDGATGNSGAVWFAEQDDERTSGEHDNFDGVRHTEHFYLAVSIGERRTQVFNQSLRQILPQLFHRTEEDNQQSSGEEDGERDFGASFIGQRFGAG